MEFYKILNQLMESAGITAYKMSKDTGIPQAVIGRWKKGERLPSNENLRKIADYFLFLPTFFYQEIKMK